MDYLTPCQIFTEHMRCFVGWWPGSSTVRRNGLFRMWYVGCHTYLPYTSYFQIDCRSTCEWLKLSARNFCELSRQKKSFWNNMTVQGKFDESDYIKTRFWSKTIMENSAKSWRLHTHNVNNKQKTHIQNYWGPKIGERKTPKFLQRKIPNWPVNMWSVS